MTSSKESETDLRIRAEHLFALCDKEEKGFVTKRDMQVNSLLFLFFFTVKHEPAKANNVT